MGASSTRLFPPAAEIQLGIAPSEASPPPHLDIMGNSSLQLQLQIKAHVCPPPAKLGPLTLTCSHSSQNITTPQLGKAAVVQVILRGYSQHHAVCFWLLKEPIASQASMVLQSYSSQGKSWSCSGSPLALRQKNKEKHHCHQHSCAKHSPRIWKVLAQEVFGDCI